MSDWPGGQSLIVRGPIMHSRWSTEQSTGLTMLLCASSGWSTRRSIDFACLHCCAWRSTNLTPFFFQCAPHARQSRVDWPSVFAMLYSTVHIVELQISGYLLQWVKKLYQQDFIFFPTSLGLIAPDTRYWLAYMAWTSLFVPQFALKSW